jgi:hypothetical protein
MGKRQLEHRRLHQSVGPMQLPRLLWHADHRQPDAGLIEAAFEQLDSEMFREVGFSRLPGTQACRGFNVIWRMGGQKSHLEFHQVHVYGINDANFRDAYNAAIYRSYV